MKLKTKVILSIIAIWSILCVLVYVNSKRILSSYYLKIEDQFVKDNLYRVKSAIGELEGVVKNIVSIWAPWDDAYNYVQNKNPLFASKELNLAMIAASDLDIVIMYNEKGKRVFLSASNEERTKQVPLPKELLDAMQPKGALWKYIENPLPEKKIGGLFLTSKHVLFFALEPIIKSDATGPAKGTFFLARYITQKSIDRIKEIANQDVTFFPLDSINQQTKLKQIFKTLTESGELLFIDKEAETLQGYSLIKDFENKPIALLAMHMSRDIYLSGLVTIRFFNSIFIALGLFFAFLLFYLLKKWVIDRLEKINHQFVLVGETKNFTLKFPEIGSDELASLGHEANKMLATIRTYDEENTRLLEKIRHELNRTYLFSKQLKAAEELLKNVINSMPSMLFLINKEGQILDINQVAERKLHISAKEALGNSLYVILPYLKNFQDKVHEANTKKMPYSIPKIHFSLGEEAPCYYNLLIFPLIKSKSNQLAIRLDDISDQVQLEEIMNQNERLASIGVLTAGVAHEINNPINFVYSAITPLQRDIEELFLFLEKCMEVKTSDNVDKQLREIENYKQEIELDVLLQETNDLLSGIEDGAKRTQTIVKKLSTYSKSDKIKPDQNGFDRSDVRKLMDAALENLQSRYKDRIQIVKDYQPIPLLECSSQQLYKAFNILLSNAIEAIINEGTISIKIEQSGKNVLISIKDTGIGISEENLGKIFDPFFTTKPVGEGVGLGLTVVQGIIKEHKGTLEVTSVLGKGTEVVIRL